MDDVAFTIDTGELFGLFGPNGAGKSTLIIIFFTLLPTQGTIRVDGEALTYRHRDIKRKLFLYWYRWMLRHKSRYGTINTNLKSVGEGV